MRKLLSLSLAAGIFVFGLLGVSQAFDLFPSPPGHNIIIAGVVKRVENGVTKPEAGATVTIRKLTDMADLGDCDLTEPQSTVTDANGVWVLVFSVPLDCTTLPDGFEGDLSSKCKPGLIHIGGDLKTSENMAGFYDFMTGRAGNATDLIKDMVTKFIKIEGLSIPTTIEYVSHGGYVYTEIRCGEDAPVKDKEEKTKDTFIPAPPTVPEPPQTPPPATPTVPENPDSFRIPDTTPKEEPKKSVDENAVCLEKCRPILDKLKALKKKLEELEKRESDEVKKLQKELDRLIKLRDQNLSSSRQQKYITPQGGEHWGLIQFQDQYKLNGYDPVPGTERTSPERQRFIDFVKNKIAEMEPKLKKAREKDDAGKENERRRLEDEMAKLRKEYEDCVSACDKRVKHDGGKGVGIDWVDFMPKHRRGDATHPARKGYFHPAEDPEVGRAEEVQYKKVEGDRTSTNMDAAVVYKPTPNGMTVDTSVTVTGQGANFRKWDIDSVTLDVDGQTVTPSKKENVYIQKESYFKGPAVATFVVLGAQYRGPAKEAESGEVCPVTGEKIKTTERKDSAVDRAGMAAGMGLLASQAKGEITGQKTSFTLNKEQSQKVLDKKAALKVNAKNASAHEAQNFKVSLH